MLESFLYIVIEINQSKLITNKSTKLKSTTSNNEIDDNSSASI